MTKPKVVKEFTDNDRYFTIKQVFQEYIGSKIVDGQHRYISRMVGLGSDDRLYVYTPSGWVAYLRRIK